MQLFLLLYFADLTGQMEMEQSMGSDPIPSPHIYHNSGRAADFLTKRGFGWLMDEEMDEDHMKPLL